MAEPLKIDVMTTDAMVVLDSPSSVELFIFPEIVILPPEAIDVDILVSWVSVGNCDKLELPLPDESPVAVG